jgi:hypothetical protein
MKTKKQIADEAKRLADALASESFGLVGATLRQLALMIADLAEVDAKPTRTCALPKCPEPATSVTGLCVAHSVRAMGDSIDLARQGEPAKPPEWEPPGGLKRPPAFKRRRRR